MTLMDRCARPPPAGHRERPRDRDHLDRRLMSRRTDYLNRQVEERTRELKGANDELMARDAELRYNLRAASRFQTRLLLPHAPPDWPELRWGVHYAPLDHLGGDYYDVAQPDADHLGFPDRRCQRAQHRRDDGRHHLAQRVRRGREFHDLPRRSAHRDERPAPGTCG